MHSSGTIGICWHHQDLLSTPTLIPNPLLQVVGNAESLVDPFAPRALPWKCVDAGVELCSFSLLTMSHHKNAFCHAHGDQSSRFVMSSTPIGAPIPPVTPKCEIVNSARAIAVGMHCAAMRASSIPEKIVSASGRAACVYLPDYTVAQFVGEVRPHTHTPHTLNLPADSCGWFLSLGVVP